MTTKKDPSSFFAAFAIAGVFVLAGALLWYAAGVSGPRLFGFQSTPLVKDILARVLGFVSVLLGVCLGSAYRHLRGLQTRGRRSIRWKTLAKQVLSSIDFKIAVLGSPVVFAGLLTLTQGMQISALTLLGIEHGFLSPILVAQFLAKHEADDGA